MTKAFIFTLFIVISSFLVFMASYSQKGEKAPQNAPQWQKRAIVEDSINYVCPHCGYHVKLTTTTKTLTPAPDKER